MDVAVTELARRLCLANHRPDLRRGLPSDATVPCGVHRQEADRYHFLTTVEGATSMAVVTMTAGENSRARSWAKVPHR